MSTSDVPKLTPRMQQTLERAEQIAEANGQEVVGTEHVILALIEDWDGIAGMVLRSVGTADSVREEVLRIIRSDGYKGSTRPRREEAT